MSTARDRSRARIEIVFGFSAAALGDLITFVSWISDGGIRYSSNEDVQSFATTFASIASVVAWWFLSQVVASDVTPRVLIRNALLWLMLEQLFLAVASLAFLFVACRDLTFAWSVLGNTLVGLGALFSAVGFYSMRRTYQHEAVEPAPAFD